MLTFESIDARRVLVDNPPSATLLYRAKIPGGWLLRGGGDGPLTFVPDPDHKWDGNSLP
jgi:hypothetical protein